MATRDARSTIVRSPNPSSHIPSTGLPVLAMPSTTRPVQFGSTPITRTAATLGFEPMPIRVRNVRSRSSPNWRRPNACGRARVPGISEATPSAAAFDRSSTGRIAT